MTIKLSHPSGRDVPVCVPKAGGCPLSDGASSPSSEPRIKRGARPCAPAVRHWVLASLRSSAGCRARRSPATTGDVPLTVGASVPLYSLTSTRPSCSAKPA